MKRILTLLLLICLITEVQARSYYVAVGGSDSNSGTISSPFATIGKLNSVMVAGDTAYIRNGTYVSAAGNGASVHFTITGLAGTASQPIVIMNYPGETPVFNLDAIVPTNDYPIAMSITNCNYLKMKGLTLKNLKQVNSGVGVSRGLFIDAPNTTIELFDVFNIGGTAIAFGDNASGSLLLNTDAHHSGDGRSPDTWNFGDAITSTDNLPNNITIRGCRLWMCGDDGFDAFQWRGTNMVIDNCWSFWNGVKPWGVSGTQPSDAGMTPSNNSFFYAGSPYFTAEGVGYGFKLGGCNPPGCVAPAITTTKKFITNCIAVENSGEGFGANMLAAYSHRMSLVNCISYKNGNDGWGFGTGRSTGIAQIFKNNWAWSNSQLVGGADFVYDGLPDNITNNWWGTTYGGVDYGNLNPPLTITNADFTSINTNLLVSARQSNGNLPVISLLHLVAGSDIIDVGVNVGLPYEGTAPDLGAFERWLPPTCNVGTTPVTTSGTSVGLSASSTSLHSLTYTWSQVSGAAATIANVNAPTTTASGLTVGTYVFRITIRDNLTSLTCTADKTVNVTSGTITPTANAGTNQTITLPTNSVVLSGSGSGGTINSYLWTTISGIGGTLSAPTSATTNLTGLVAGTYNVQLRVGNTDGNFGYDTVTITVNPAPVAPTCSAGTTPVSITLPVSTVGLSATGSGVNPVSYLWSKVSGTGSTITAPTSASTNATGLTAGSYVYRITVTDNVNGLTCTSDKAVTVNPALVIPTANAGANQTITLPTSTVALSGSGSGGTINSYLWTKISGLGGTFSAATSANTNFSGLSAGVYQIQLMVGNTDGNFGYDTVQVTVNPAPTAPTCSAGATPVTITLPTNRIGLSGSGSGVNAVSFLWTKISGTGGAITSPTSASTTATGLTAGTYVYRLTVTDNVNGLTCTSDKTITVNTAVTNPSVSVGSDQVIQLPTNSVTVTATATPSTGSITAYSWALVAGGTNTITSPTSSTTTITGLVEGVYYFQCTVTQTGGLTASDTIMITVNPVSLPVTVPKFLQASLNSNPTNVVLGWTSDITENTQYFVLQKLGKNNTFGNRGANIIPKIGIVDYWAYDYNVVRGDNTYRIKVVDKTGITYSETKTVKKNSIFNLKFWTW